MPWGRIIRVGALQDMLQITTFLKIDLPWPIKIIHKHILENLIPANPTWNYPNNRIQNISYTTAFAIKNLIVSFMPNLPTACKQGQLPQHLLTFPAASKSPLIKQLNRPRHNTTHPKSIKNNCLTFRSKITMNEQMMWRFLHSQTQRTPIHKNMTTFLQIIHCKNFI